MEILFLNRKLRWTHVVSVKSCSVMKIERSDFKFGSNCIFFRSKQAETIEKMLKPDDELMKSVVKCLKKYKAQKLWNIAAIWINYFLKRKGII